MIGEQDEPLPPHKQELIDWLGGFRHTAGLIAMIRHYQITPQEAAAWKRQFERWLKPKVDREAHHARSLG